jgi:acyl-CoA synthetase (NDP forming)
MTTNRDLDVFLDPASVAVIGATERPGAWGSFIMRGLLSLKYPGNIYPVNRKADKVSGIPASPDIEGIKGPVDLAVLTIPDAFVEEAIAACGRKGVKGLIIITAGFGETSHAGRERQEALAALARSHGIRILGPNVSGTFNIPARFNASPTPADYIVPAPIAAACQGSYAFYDLLYSGSSRGMGVGKFIHTGNESDLTVTDFFEAFGHDPEVKAVVMYIEALRDARRFIDVARAVTKKKPVVVYKAGRTPGSSRAARSHTGALSGEKRVYDGLFHQVGIIASPTMELLLPLCLALIERPPMRGPRVAIITMGGSWGVALSDALEEAGLLVPEFGPKLQEALRAVGMPPRASTRNPVDFGASGLFYSVDTPLELSREILASGEADALVVHGIGRPGMHDENTPEDLTLLAGIEKEQITKISALEKESGIPVLIGSHYNPWESQVVSDLNRQGIRLHNRVHEIAQLLSLLYNYWKSRPDMKG